MNAERPRADKPVEPGDLTPFEAETDVGELGRVAHTLDAQNAESRAT